MTNLLFVLAVMSLRLPDVETFEAYDWQPQFTDAKDVRLTEPAVAILTHSSRHFDPLCLTQSAVNDVVAAMKAAHLPVLYLHDRYNSNNRGWLYLYEDWRPTAFVPSDVGHVDLNLTAVRHVVCLGGFFGQCERTTVTNVIRCWRRDATQDDLRITQIVDGIFCVAEHVRYEDPFGAAVRDYFYRKLRQRHPKAVISVDRILSFIDDRDLALDYLSRQLPPIPTDVNVVFDFFGEVETVQVARSGAPTLTFAYRRSDQFLKFQPAVANLQKPHLHPLRRSVGRPRSGRILP